MKASWSENKGVQNIVGEVYKKSSDTEIWLRGKMTVLIGDVAEGFIKTKAKERRKKKEEEGTGTGHRKCENSNFMVFKVSDVVVQ